MATCNKCGKINYEGVKYCTACGTPLSLSDNTFTNSPQDENTNQPSGTSEAGEKKQIRNFENSPKKNFDPRILYVILGIIVLASLVFFVKRCMDPKNETVHFTYSPTDSIFTGTTVTFTDQTKNAKSWDWDFGDNSGINPIDQIVSHEYSNAGRYVVRLTVNGKNTDSIIIMVYNKIMETKQDIDVVITGPQNVILGEKVSFKDNTPNATWWKWRMGESGEIDSKEQTITYVFKTPGWKTISVINSEAIKNGHLKVFVSRKVVSGPANPGKPKCPPNIEMKLKKLLVNFASGNYSEKENIIQLLGGDKTMPTIYNNATTNLYGMLFNIDNEYQNKRKISINKVSVTLNNEGCPMKLTVTSIITD